MADSSASDLVLGSADQIAKANVGIKSGSLIVAPIPFSNPILGQGLTLGAGYLFTLPGSKPSGIGAAKMSTSNGSNAQGVGGSINFRQGAWTISFLAADATFFYDLPFDARIFDENFAFDLPLGV